MDKFIKKKDIPELTADLTILLYDFKRTVVKSKKSEIKLINDTADKIINLFKILNKGQNGK